MAEFLTDEEIDALLEIAEQGELPNAQAELPDLNPKQIELGLQFATKLLGEDYGIPNYKLAEIQSQILDWNICRNNIDYDEASELAMYASEAQEEIDAEGDIHEIIDANCDRFLWASCASPSKSLPQPKTNNASPTKIFLSSLK